MALDFDTRIAIAHRLLSQLGDKQEITRWQFWDRIAVKEQAEEIADRTLSDEEVDGVMHRLTIGWDAISGKETENLTDAIKDALEKIKTNS